MKILIIGDIVAKAGRTLVMEILPGIIKEKEIDFVIANAENVAHGRGANREIIENLQKAGVDFFTSGDHIFHIKNFEDEIETLPIIRPANFPEGAPGEGYKVVDAGKHGKILIINLIGRVFLNELVDNPFTTADQILEKFENDDISLKIVDFHAEASSEKMALAHYLDGRVDIFYGTHTHIPSADTLVLSQKTLYVSDIGMTGIIDSVLGVEKDIIIQKFLTGRKQRFEWENTGTKAFRGVLLDTDSNRIKRLDFEK